jgi:hypothetical protein
MAKPELDIARNMRTIEWLKAELVGGVSGLFRALIKNSDEAILDALANVVVACYLLARRLGITFSRFDMQVESKVTANITQNHEIEQWYGDFTAFRRYLEERTGSG